MITKQIKKEKEIRSTDDSGKLILQILENPEAYSLNDIFHASLAIKDADSIVLMVLLTFLWEREKEEKKRI